MRGSYNIPDRTRVPTNGKTIDLNLSDPESVRFDNGLEVFLIDEGDEEVTRIDVIFQAGSVYQNKRLIASGTGKLLKEGTQSYTSAEIAELFDYYGAYFDIHVTKDSSTLTLYTLTRHLDKLLPVISEMITEATFPEHELEIFLEQQKQEFLVNSEKVRYKAMLEFNKLVFGEGSAYGQVVELSDFDKLEQQDLTSFYRQRYTAENAYIIASGKADETVLNTLRQYLGNGLMHNPGDQPPVNYVGKNGSKEKFVEKGGALQSAIRIGRMIMDKKHPDYNKFILLNTIFGGYFGSRLMSNLREDKGFTYGVNSYSHNYLKSSIFSINTEVNSSFTQAAIDEVFKEMELLRTELVSSEELDLVKNYIYGTFLRNFDGPFALADRFRAACDFGLGFEYYLRSLDVLMKITAEEILETAQKYFDPADMIKLVVGRFE